MGARHRRLLSAAEQRARAPSSSIWPSRACLAAPALAQPKTIKAVMHSDLKVLDPIWTTANIVRNHGYMVWDTLFAMDEKLRPQPQMVDAWSLSDDRLTYTFTLRDGLKWHDGKPVTSRGLHRLAQALGRARFDRAEADELRRGLRGGRTTRPSGSCSRSPTAW